MAAPVPDPVPEKQKALDPLGREGRLILLVVSTPPGVPSQAVLFNCCFIPVQIDKYPESIIQDYLSINSFHQKNQDIFLESRPLNHTMTFSKIPDSIKLVMGWLNFDTIRPDQWFILACIAGAGLLIYCIFLGATIRIVFTGTKQTCFCLSSPVGDTYRCFQSCFKPAVCRHLD